MTNLLKKIASLTVAALLFLHLSFPIQALQTQALALQTDTLLTRLDELYSQRSELAIDYDNHLSAIQNIDMQLAQLGVEDISVSELTEKFTDGLSPMATVPTSIGVEWDSIRTTIPYNGKLYEIQVITGIYNGNSNSPLRTTCVETVSKNDFEADVISLLAADLGQNGIDYVVDILSNSFPVVGSAIAYTGTILEILEEADESINGEITYVDNIECTYHITMISTMRYVFIKPQGTADAGNQIIGYCGNRTNFEIITLLAGNLTNTIEEEIYPFTEITRCNDYIESKGYQDSYNMAGSIMYQYKELGYSEQQLDNEHFVGATRLRFLIDETTNEPAGQVVFAIPLDRIW